MEPKFQSSFIPKGPLATTGNITPTSRSAHKSILGTLASIIFTISIVLGLAVFGYELYLNRNIGQMASDLRTARADLQPEVINRIADIDQRIVSTKDLLDNHIILSPLFEYLESSTLRTVGFSSFSYETTEKGLVLSMRGQARGYSAVALQSEIFNRSPYFSEPIFSDLSLDDRGNVTFSFRAMLDSSIVSYRSSADAQEEAPVETPQTATSSPSGAEQ